MADQQGATSKTKQREASLLRYLAMSARSPVEFEKLLRQARLLESQASTSYQN